MILSYTPYKPVLVHKQVLICLLAPLLTLSYVYFTCKLNTSVTIADIWMGGLHSEVFFFFVRFVIMLITVTQRTSNPFKEASEVRGGVTGFLSTLALGPWHVLHIAQPCGGPAVTRSQLSPLWMSGPRPFILGISRDSAATPRVGIMHGSRPRSASPIGLWKAGTRSMVLYLAGCLAQMGA